MKRHRHTLRGSVVLVALCFVAVLSIAVTTYITLSHRALKLSNRSFQTSLSVQLAESGLEQALWAFNKNDWTGWTISGTTATRTLTFASTKFGTSGIATSIKLQVLHRNAANWNPATAYAVGSLAWYRGLWRLCVTANGPTNTPPAGSANWISAPGLWNFSAPYAVGDIVLVGSTAYRCTVAHTNQQPPNASFWTVNTSGTWSSATAYAVNDIAFSGGTPYRCRVAHTNQPPPNTGFWVSTPVIYSEGISTPPDGTANATRTQLRAQVAPAPLFPNAIGATTTNNPSVRLASTGTIDSFHRNTVATSRAWASGTTYAVGDIVYHAATFLNYRCTVAHTSSPTVTPTDTTRWVSNYFRAGTSTGLTMPTTVFYPPGNQVYRCLTTGTTQLPVISDWSATTDYVIGNFAFHSTASGGTGLLYRAINNSTNKPPASHSGHWTQVTPDWTPAIPGHPTWSPSLAYTVGQIVYYPTPLFAGGTNLLYRCISDHTNRVPTNTSFWAAQDTGFDDWSSATAYSTLGTVVYYPPTGLLYRNINTASNTNRIPSSNPTYWSYPGPGHPTWLPAASYAVGDVVTNPAIPATYFCTTAHTSTAANIPPNASFWTTTPPGYAAVVAGPFVTLSSTDIINGFVATGSLTANANASVKGTLAIPSPRIDPQRVSSSPFVPAFDIQSVAGAANLPVSEGNGTWLNAGATALGTPGATSPAIYNITRTYTSGTSTTSGLYLDGATDILTINGPVILNVSGILYFNSGRIAIGPNGSLEVYFNGQLYIGNNVSTGGGIVNQSLDPGRLLIVGTNNNNSSSYNYLWTRLPFYGRVYMPEAYLHVWNSGYDRDIYGALSAKTVYFNHTAHVHYDNLLRTTPGGGTFIDTPFEITRWRELTPAERVSL